MAYQYTDYSGYGNETDEETRKRRAMLMAGMSPDMNFGDMAGQALSNRLGQAQNTINQTGQMFTNPEEEIRKRMGMQPVAPSIPTEEQVAQQAEEVTPVKQTITTNPQTGEQTIKIEGSAKDLSAANPLTPTITGPAAPTAPTREEAQAQQEQLQQQLQQYRPVAPTQVQPARQMVVPQTLPAEGIIPAQAATQPIPQMQVPQPGPAVQVAGPAVMPAAAPNIEEVHREAIIKGANETNPILRRDNFARIIADPNASEGNKALANKLMYDDYKKQRDIDLANQALQEATPNDLARYMKEQKKEGSYVKAILFARLGLTELAQKEQEKIDPTITMSSAVDNEGNKYTVGRDKAGNITTGFDSNGKQINQETIAKLSAAAMPTKAFLLPQSGGGLMQKTIIGPDGKPQVITGQVFTDPQTNTTYFQAGNKRYDTSGLSTPAQNVQNVYSAAAAGAAGKAGGEGFTPQPLPAFPGQVGGAPAGVPGAPAVAPSAVVAPGVDEARRAQSDIQALDREIALSQQRPFGNPQQQAQRMATLNDEKVKAQQRLQAATSAVQAAPAVAPTAPAAAPAVMAPTAGMPVWQQRQQAAIGQKQAEETIQVAGKRSESFNKILDEEVRPQAQAGDTVSSVRKQQFAIFDRPGVDSNKLFGLYNASQESPNDQKLSIVRDIFGGVFKPEAEVSQRLAQLNLTPQEKSALAEYNIANQRINAATLKQTAGPGSVSDAEQRANRESNVDPTKIPALGAYNAMAQSQFSGDMARYKADWAENHPATNALQLDKAWRKESSSLSQVYGDIAKKRAEYIASNGATTAAVKDGYKKFPIPEYDPNTGTWKKTKPIAEILGR